MKPHYRFLPTVFVVMLLFGGNINWVRHNNGDKWNGTVSFIVSGTGPDIVTSEWRMDGTFRNSMGPVVHSAKFNSKDDEGEIRKNCSTTSEGRVEIDFDEIKGTYTIIVRGVRDCEGTAVEYGVTKAFSMPGGDTAIIIPNQPLGHDHNSLTGSINYKEGPHQRGNMQSQIFKWNLVKAPE